MATDTTTNDALHLDTSAAREWILEQVRKGKPKLHPLPEVPLYDYPGDPLENFIQHLKGFDGKAIQFDNKQLALDWLKEHFSNTDKKVFSALADYDGNIHLSDFKTPHDAHVIEICVAQGILGVGETGSIWVNNESLKLAASALFSTDLYLLLDKTTIVSGLHQAYTKFNLRDHQYGSFYTGPSATADIEAVHITGAQAELSLTALIY